MKTVQRLYLVHLCAARHSLQAVHIPRRDVCVHAGPFEPWELWELWRRSFHIMAIPISVAEVLDGKYRRISEPITAVDSRTMVLWCYANDTAPAFITAQTAS